MKKFQLIGASALALFSAAVLAPVVPAAPLLPQEGDAEEEEDTYLALVGGDVHTGLGGLLREATILVKNDKVEAFGYDVVVPEEAEVVDVTGLRVYPGLIAVGSFGLFGGGGNLTDSVDPYNQNMTLALAAGVTTAVNGSSVAKLKRGHVEGLTVKSQAWDSWSFSNSNPTGQLKVRENLKKAAAYLRAYRQWEIDKRSNKELKEPSKKGVDQKSVDVLTGKTRPKFSANDRTDLLEIARLAQEFGFRPIIEGCTEGWTIADELGRAGATAIVTPRSRRAKSELQVADGGTSIENAAKLHAHGVSVVVVPASRGISLGGIVGQDLLHLPIEAGFAIRGGLSEQAALESITIQAARALDLGHRIGSIEVGKDADLIVTDGDLLHYQTFVQWAIVDGEIVYDKQEEMFFAHIRPRPESSIAPEESVDAGEEDVLEVEESSDEEGDAEDTGDAEDADDADETGDEAGSGGGEPEEEPAQGPEDSPGDGS
ncbi:MAG: amidohydrolase family protein [Planctomycetota bacterium]|nr:amidohydrolase family protein [Planctomycetota bacterium]